MLFLPVCVLVHVYLLCISSLCETVIRYLLRESLNVLSKLQGKVE